MPFSCHSALQRLGAKPSLRVPPAEPPTPSSPHSLSSSPSAEEMRYVDYKLKQYQIKVGRKESKKPAREPTPPAPNFARRVKTKIGSLLQGRTKKRVAAYHRGCESPRRKIVFGSKRPGTPDPRHALEVTESQREEVGAGVALEEIRLEFSEKYDDYSSVRGLLSPEEFACDVEKGPRGLFRDGAAYSKPTVEDADPVESHHGVIVLEAQGLEAIEPRRFV